MNQTTPNPASGQPAKSARVYTRDLVQIGQLWMRARDKKCFTIHQVHRGERSVELVPLGQDPALKGSRLLVKFADLRCYYRKSKNA